MKLFNDRDRNDCEILHFCDGDTVYVRAHCRCCGLSRTLYVRIKGIESHEPKGSTRHLASAIAQKWTDKFAGQKAELKSEQNGSDRYGRAVGSLFINGKSLADMLVESGDSWYNSHKRIK